MLCHMLSINGVSHAGICHRYLFKVQWATNPEVLFDVLGTKQRKSDQSSLSSCSQASQCGWLEGLRRADVLLYCNWYEAAGVHEQQAWHAWRRLQTPTAATSAVKTSGSRTSSRPFTNFTTGSTVPGHLQSASVHQHNNP